MCGIVGASSQRNISDILLEGLKRLEYRGYDSAGMAVINNHGELELRKHSGKVAILEQDMIESAVFGLTGIAHTRWATHGAAVDNNAHPHRSEHIAVVHNGIIENYQALKQRLVEAGYTFISDTDTETIVHLIHYYYQQTANSEEALLDAFELALAELEGAYALAVVSSKHPQQVIATRQSSPLVVGKGVGESYVSSDTIALRQVTDQFYYLQEQDIVVLNDGKSQLYRDGSYSDIQFTVLDDYMGSTDKGGYRHYMLKEIYQQPQVIEETLKPYLGKSDILIEAFGIEAAQLLRRADAIQIIACGSSHYAAQVAKHWIESWSNLLCQTEIASEYLYRDNHVPKNCLFISISQSGETADTLASLRKAKKQNYLGNLAICNVANSTLVRESDAYMLTRAGFEISVASTKAFVTQLTALKLVAIALSQIHNPDLERQQLIEGLRQLPQTIAEVLKQAPSIQKLATRFANEKNMLFLGRGLHFPIASEGALKMKEISYIHAEAYPSGELKHGPLALVDEHMPVIAIAPNNDLLNKLQSNLSEVAARGGQLYAFTDNDVKGLDDIHCIRLPNMPESITPIAYTVPLQLLAYEVALIQGHDIDHPRNLAKSVTVE